MKKVAIVFAMLVLLFSCKTPAVPDSSPSPSPVAEPSPTPSLQTGYVASKEEYEQTFQDVSAVIAELNGIIREHAFEKWKSYLTGALIAYLENPETMAALSQQPTMLRNGIVLKSTQDYFSYVVVPSRANIRLDSIDFDSPTRVKAIMLRGETRIVVYSLEKIGGKWLLSTW